MISLVAALALLFPTDPPRARLSGGFIQLTSSSALESTRLVRQQWRDVLLAMNKAGLDKVVIQYLEIKGGGGSLMRPEAPDDATELILSEADALKMTVLVGLWDRDFPTTEFTAGFFEEAKAKTLAVLDTAWNTMHYGKHLSFGGWYIPIEPWNFANDAMKVQWLSDYLATVSARCKQFAPCKPVAFSCFFNPDQSQYASPGETARVYGQVLAAAHVDILMLQDGVGEYHHTATDCRAYYTAWKEACGDKVRLWADLECFDRVSENSRVPARASRLASQIENATGVTDTLVTFDFFH